MNIWERFLQLISNNGNTNNNEQKKEDNDKLDLIAKIYAKETINNAALSAIFINILRINDILKKEEFEIYPSVKYDDLNEFKADLFSLYMFPLIYKYDILTANKYRILKQISNSVKDVKEQLNSLMMNTSYVEYVYIKPYSISDNSCKIMFKCNINVSDILSQYDLSNNEIVEIVKINLRDKLKNIEILNIKENIYQNNDKTLKQKVYEVESILEYDDSSICKLYNLIINKQGDINEIIHSGLKKIYSQFYLNNISIFTNIDKEVKVMKKNTIEGHVLRAICFIPDIVLHNPKLDGKENENVIKTNDLLSKLYSDMFGLDDNSLNDINYNELLKAYK